MVHAGFLSRPLNGQEISGEPVDTKTTIHALARLLVEDKRELLPIADASGKVTGVLERQAGLDILLGQH